MTYKLPIKLYDVTFHNRLLNSAGCWCTTEQELTDLLESHCGGIVSKSCLFEPYKGNPHPRVFYNEVLSINSTGLANQGYLFYNNIGKEITKFKPYIISIGVKNIDETFKMIQSIEKNQYCDFIELNISCPNIIGKPILGYNISECLMFFSRLFSRKDHHAIINNTNKLKIGLKLPPYFDQVQLKEMSDIINTFPIKYICSINGMPNGLVLNEFHEKVIEPNDGIGGMGGCVAKPFGLSNVKSFRRLLPTLPIIGCGGISTKKDIEDYFSVGASLVQIGTQLIREGPSCFERLLKN